MTKRENRLESQGPVDPGHRFERGERRRVALPPRTCANIASPTGIRALEESSDDGRYPPSNFLPRSDWPRRCSDPGIADARLSFAIVCARLRPIAARFSGNPNSSPLRQFGLA